VSFGKLLTDEYMQIKQNNKIITEHLFMNYRVLIYVLTNKTEKAGLWGPGFSFTHSLTKPMKKNTRECNKSFDYLQRKSGKI
jgi:hypothetical protein